MRYCFGGDGASHGSEPALVVIFEPSQNTNVSEYKLIYAFEATDFDYAIGFEIYSSKNKSWDDKSELLNTVDPERANCVLSDIIRDKPLSFLPAKSLFRFMAVCHHWKRLILTPSFHLDQSLRFTDKTGESNESSKEGKEQHEELKRVAEKKLFKERVVQSLQSKTSWGR
nr:F-box protein At5g49610-like [Ipomoea batatas]